MNQLSVPGLEPSCPFHSVRAMKMPGSQALHQPDPVGHQVLTFFFSPFFPLSFFSHPLSSFSYIWMAVWSDGLRRRLDCISSIIFKFWSRCQLHSTSFSYLTLEQQQKNFLKSYLIRTSTSSLLFHKGCSYIIVLHPSNYQSPQRCKVLSKWWLLWYAGGIHEPYLWTLYQNGLTLITFQYEAFIIKW